MAPPQPILMGSGTQNLPRVGIYKHIYVTALTCGIRAQRQGHKDAATVSLRQIYEPDKTLRISILRRLNPALRGHMLTLDLNAPQVSVQKRIEFIIIDNGRARQTEHGQP
ncbi:hypothetical protein GCM10011273_26840 [Asticcacaulis endophyticus]|uniref:Uncharacterized protein n=1 Tax=Asticcacaulis endophyticus TaxID=1395890 RepID=A0A918UWB4_9CAUL|nr:hypothetical protein GCM10011273_26840 [Asticcacaulis endophyticus]